MRILTVTSKEFEDMKSLQPITRCDWPAVFSTNARGEIFAYPARRGWTKRHEREQVEGISPILDQIAAIYRQERPNEGEGGRFFVDDELACYNDSREINQPKTVFLLIKKIE